MYRAAISTGGHMLRQPGEHSSRKAIAFGLVAASFTFLSGCEPSTSPSRSLSPEVSRSLSRDYAPAHGLVVHGTGDPSVDVPRSEERRVGKACSSRRGSTS